MGEEQKRKRGDKMILFQKNVDGYDVKVKTTEMYDRGEITDDDDVVADITVKGKGHSIKAPIWAPLPKEITEVMVRRFLKEEGL